MGRLIESAIGVRGRGSSACFPGKGFLTLPSEIAISCIPDNLFLIWEKFRSKSWSTVSREKIQNGFYLGDFVTCTRYGRPGDSFRIRESWHI